MSDVWLVVALSCIVIVISKQSIWNVASHILWLEKLSPAQVNFLAVNSTVILLSPFFLVSVELDQQIFQSNSHERNENMSVRKKMVKWPMAIGKTLVE